MAFLVDIYGPAGESRADLLPNTLLAKAEAVLERVLLSHHLLALALILRKPVSCPMGRKDSHTIV